MSSTKRGSERNKNDAYYTPKWCVQGLVEMINWDLIGTFHEPCYGNGSIYHQIPLDDFQKSWSEIDKGKDYLDEKQQDVDLIITNPPFKLAEQFILKSLSHSKNVIMLLRLNFLESQIRYDFWNNNKPNHIIVLSNRPSFTQDGKTDSVGYGWYVWNKYDILKDNSPFQWIKK